MSVYAISHSCICPLGNDSGAVFQAVLEKKAAFREYALQELLPGTPGAGREKIIVSALDAEQRAFLKEQFDGKTYSRLEQMCLWVAREALKKVPEVAASAADCVFILSSTKGNIDYLGHSEEAEAGLFTSAKQMVAYFKNPNRPVVISNACISGALALQTGKRLLENNIFKHAVIVGADIVSPFVLSGFQSFHALSATACRPFDENRDGLNLGEAAACMILSRDAGAETPVALLAGGATSNDANHISGPSRTGEELATAIRKCIKEGNLSASEIDFISAHGTATRYNDEMEAKAFSLAAVSHAPVHSLKSFIGHTLGAAGIIESIIACMGMVRQTTLPSLNFDSSGVSVPLRVSTEASPRSINYVLKTASGFGGCNAALVWKKAGA
jgi:3-oxoacyl-[acyl-carrier-protein] synthase-1